MVQSKALMRKFAVLLSAALVGACGGGGGVDSSATDSSNGTSLAPVSRLHAPATLALSAENAQNVAAHGWFSFMVINDFALFLPSVVQFRAPTIIPLASPDRPTVRFNCNAASIDLSYVDTDRNGQMSVGDVIRMSGGCGPGSAVDVIDASATLLAVDATGVVSIRIDVAKEKHTRLSPYGLTAELSGSFVADRLPNFGLRLSSVGSVRVSSGNARSVNLSNFALAYSNRPVFGFYADMSTDMSLQTSVVSGQMVQVEVIDGPLTISGGYNEVLSQPSKLQIVGVGSSRLTLSGQPDNASLRLDVTPGPSGTVQTTLIPDAAALYTKL